MPVPMKGNAGQRTNLLVQQAGFEPAPRQVFLFTCFLYLGSSASELLLHIVRVHYKATTDLSQV